MPKRLSIFPFLLLASYYLLLTTPAFAYGENCVKNEGPNICQGTIGGLVVCTDKAAPICRCKEERTGSSLPDTRADCFSDARSFEDCAAWEDRTWVGTFRACMSLGETLNLTIQWAIVLAGAAALARLLIGAVQYIMSSGDPKNIQNARESLTSAVLGLILIVSAYLITKTLSAGFEEYGLPIKLLEFGP